MAMVDVDDSCQFLADSHPKLINWLGLHGGGGNHPALSLHSSDERFVGVGLDAPLLHSKSTWLSERR